MNSNVTINPIERTMASVKARAQHLAELVRPDGTPTYFDVKLSGSLTIITDVEISLTTLVVNIDYKVSKGVKLRRDSYTFAVKGSMKVQELGKAVNEELLSVGWVKDNMVSKRVGVKNVYVFDIVEAE